MAGRTCEASGVQLCGRKYGEGRANHRIGAAGDGRGRRVRVRRVHSYRVSPGIRSGTENWDRYRYFNANACNPWEILQPVRTGVGGVGWGGELSVMGDDAGLYRPCWDCGRRTGSWCDGGTATGRCSAVAVCPAEQWEQGQATPLCTTCVTVHGRCHTCRGVSGCRPFAWGHPGGGTQAGPYSQ